jgi:uncharacterized membrane protein
MMRFAPYARNAIRNMPRKHLAYGLLIVLVLVMTSLQVARISPYHPARSGGVEYFRAKVLNMKEPAANEQPEQHLAVKLMDGSDAGKTYNIDRPINFSDASTKRLPVGSEVLLTKEVGNSVRYSYQDRWRLPGVGSLFFILLVLVIVIGAWRGITSVLGLTISIGILATFVLPQILAGHSAFAVCIEGAILITLVSVYIAHGFRARTSVAFVSSLLTLFLVAGLVALATYLAGTSEVLTEDSAGILYSSQHISLSGLLTGGMVIASLGVLYDITTGQAAAVDEVYGANKKLPFGELYRRGLSIGREHIAALVNTLALVYVGIALPFIVTTALYGHAPLLIAFNSETVVEEVVRTFVASAGMLLAVPLTTALAAYTLPQWYGGELKKKLVKELKALW